MAYLLIFLVLLVLELGYFKIANHYNVIDKPNHRSSHSIVTLRGGGIIFALGAFLHSLLSGFEYPWFLLGLLIISAVSFLDDVFTLSNRIRVGFHLISVGLLFYQWSFFNEIPLYILFIGVVFVVAVLNAYNFMDGINGITGGYSLLAVSTLYYINEVTITFTSSHLLVTVGLSLLVFNFFNFRKTALCFAGDVGSISMAFIIIFLLGQLIWKSQNPSYLLLLLFYGLDTGITIALRIWKHENIFKAHRRHFYQFLVNERSISHLKVSSLYVLIQLLINIGTIRYINYSVTSLVIAVSLSAVVFLILRLWMERKTWLN